MSVQRMEVRCCCIPEKLLGWLPADNEKDYATYVLVEPVNYIRQLTHRVKFRKVTLPIKKIFVPGKGIYLALSSDETPMVVLRRIPEFIENKEAT